jgi:hypothetical protein
MSLSLSLSLSSRHHPKQQGRVQPALIFRLSFRGTCFYWPNPDMLAHWPSWLLGAAPVLVGPLRKTPEGKDVEWRRQRNGDE